MQTTTFDSLARLAGRGQSRDLFTAVPGVLGRGATRRQGIAAALGAVANAAVLRARGAAAETTAAPFPAWRPAAVPPSVCDISEVRDLQTLAPGTLIASQEITPDNNPAIPAGARIWQVRYVSTGRDNTERTLVCGIVAAPSDPAKLDMTEVDGEPAARMIAWTHGTLGITQRCQPSHQPDLAVWGPPPFGIGGIGWGAPGKDGKRVYQGPPEDGMLVSMLERGWIVTATDYQDETSPGAGYQPFVIGKIAAANALDNLRAAHYLLASVYGAPPASRYDITVWGHSQGGHTAMWTGQIAEPYFVATAAPDGPRFRLRGVALEAAASNLLTDPEREDPSLMGFSMFDWIADMQPTLTGIPVPIPAAPMFISYIAKSWQHWAGAGSPDPAAMPAFPDVGPLDPSAMITPAGLIAVDRMTEFGGRCWADGEPVAEVALPFVNTPYLKSIFSDGEQVGDLQHGNFDRACADPAVTADPAVAAWCAWIRYQNPGPLGAHDLPKIPMQDGALVPLLITHGAADAVVHCVTTTPGADGLPEPRDCVSVRLYQTLVSEYCPDGDAKGALTLAIWNPQEGVTIADHSAITGLAAAADGAAPDALAFTGSPLDQFLTAAFAGSVEPGCSAGLRSFA
ncbi:MAG: lipase family protein [Thermomicrobiales bacterium]